MGSIDVICHVAFMLSIEQLINFVGQPPTIQERNRLPNENWSTSIGIVRDTLQKKISYISIK